MIYDPHSTLYRYHKPIRKPVFCPNASTLGHGRYSARRGDLIVYRETYTDGTSGRRLARVLALATHDGRGVLFTETGPRGAVKPKPRLLVLAANDTLTYAYERLVDVEWVEVIRASNAQNAAFAAWFVAGDMPSTESVLGAVAYGAVTASFWDKYADEKGALREDWREVDRAKDNG